MPSPTPPVLLPPPAEFEDLLRHLSAIYTQAYLERQSLRLQVSALGGNSLGKENGGLSGGVHSHDPSPSKADWTDRKLDAFLTANVAPERALPMSDPPQPFEEVAEKEDSLSESVLIVDHTNSLAALQPKRCCWISCGKHHLEQYERLAARYTCGSNVLSMQNLLALTEEYHPSMNKDFSRTALEFFVSHSTEGIDSNVFVSDSMEGLDSSNRDILHFPAFNLLAGKQSFPSDQVMQDFVPALLQMRNAIWLEEEDFRQQMRRDQEDWEMQIMDIIATVLIILNALVISITVDLEMTYAAREWVDAAFTAFFLVELLFKLYVLGPTKFYTGVAWRWNVFDSFLVLMSLVDTAVMNTVFDSAEAKEQAGPHHNIILLIRLSRLVRLMRLLRFEMFSDLRAMVAGVFAAMRILFWAMFLFLAFIFLVAIVIRVTVGEIEVNLDSEKDYFQDRTFGSLSWSFFTLFRCFTEGCSAPDGTPLQVHLLEKSGWVFMACYIALFMFATFGISNLIMALFIEHVMNASLQKRKRDQEQNADELEAKLKEMILQLAQRDRLFKTGRSRKGIGAILRERFNSWIQPKRLKEKSARAKSSYLNRKLHDEELLITRDAFNIWLKDDEMLDLLEEMDVDTAFKSGLFDCLDSDRSGELKVEELISGLMTLRGPTEKCDTVATLLCVRHQSDMILDIHARLCRDNATLPLVFSEKQQANESSMPG